MLFLRKDIPWLIALSTWGNIPLERGKHHSIWDFFARLIGLVLTFGLAKKTRTVLESSWDLNCHTCFNLRLLRCLEKNMNFYQS